MSNLIKLNNGTAAVAENEWTIVKLPASQVEERKQAGKVVLFKLTGEKTVTQEQIARSWKFSRGNLFLSDCFYCT